VDPFDSDVQYAWNGDVALAYRLVGTGAVDLLYLPGFTSNVEYDWDSPAQARFLRRLSTFSRLIMMDRRGWGCSDRFGTDRLPPLETLMEDVTVVLDSARSRQPAIWASGDNGLLAMLFAATHPDRVRSLVLYDCTPSVVKREDMPWQPVAEELLPRRGPVWGTREFARQAFASAGPSALGDQREFEWYVRWLRLSGSPGSFEAATRRYADSDLRQVLPAIHVPTLILHRTAAAGQPIETARYLANHIEGSRLLELPGRDLMHWLGDVEPITTAVEEFVTGSSVAGTHTRRLLTLLFTDIVGSTARSAEIGDGAWADVLDAHNRLVRDELRRFEGVEVDKAGDGFFATFDRPARALDCVESIQRALASLELKIRAGCHTGEVEVTSNEVKGLAVHVAARIMSLAGPDEVYVSPTVKDLVLGSGRTFESRGEYELKGVPDRWRLYRVVDRQQST